jgi:conjugal transfer pilus assembly protein TraD
VNSNVKRDLTLARWRKSFEFRTAIAGFIILLYYAYLFRTREINDELSLALIYLIPALITVVIVVRISQSFLIWFRRIRIYGKSLELWDEEKQYKVFNDKPGYICIGTGYDWKNEHSQGAYEARKLDEDLVKPNKLIFWIYNRLHKQNLRYIKAAEDRAKGKGWIHGLNDKYKNLYVSLKDLVDGFLIVGTTGSGKTRLLELLVSQDIHTKPQECSIMIDPKIDKDLWPRMLYECEKAGRPNDFVFFSLAHPTYSVGINPLHNYSNPVDIATRLMAIIPDSGQMDGFQAFMWEKIEIVASAFELIGKRSTINNIFSAIELGPESIVKEVILHYAEDNNIPSWRTAYEQYLKKVSADAEGMYYRPTETIKDDVVASVVLYKELIKDIEPSIELGSLVEYYEADPKHSLKMLASVKPFFKALRTGAVAKLLSPDLDDNMDRPWWDISGIVKANKVLYFGTNSMGNEQISTAVATMIITDLNEVASSRYNYGYSGDNNINLKVDESSSLVVPAFISLLNKGRGAGIRSAFASQLLPDFEVRLGSEAARDQVLGNANQVLALRVKDQNTKEYLSNEMGEALISTTQTSQSTSPMSSDKDVTNFQGSYGERTTEAEAPKISPALLGEIPNLEFIANMSGGRVVKGKIPILPQPEGGLPGFEDLNWVKRVRETGGSL